MKERINKIKSIAWQYAEKNSSDGDGTHGNLFTNKIIELTIMECISVLDKEEEYCGSALIQGHFGIKNERKN